MTQFKLGYCVTSVMEYKKTKNKKNTHTHTQQKKRQTKKQKIKGSTAEIYSTLTKLQESTLPWGYIVLDIECQYIIMLIEDTYYLLSLI